MAVPIDRVSIRQRPEGTPLMLQTWGKLLFLHWRMPAEALRPLIPAPLEIDTHEGEAWVGVTPFTMWGLRLPGMPALPVVSRTHELNVRTYVHHDGVPGVWFLSLDAMNPLAVWGARFTFHLPYYQADMHFDGETHPLRFVSQRAHAGAPAASFEAEWRRGSPLGMAEPGSLEFFLVERYCLYATTERRLYRARIHHAPWPLCAAEVLKLESSMLESHGLPTPTNAPLVHAQGEALDVEVWRAEPIAEL